MNIDKKIWQWVVLLTLALIWGSSFILMKRGLEVFSHTTVAALRITISFIFLLPIIIQRIHTIKKEQLFYLIAAGIIGSGIPAFLFTKAQTEISSSLSGMLNSLTPIFALLIGVLFFKTKNTKLQIIGVILGLIGAVGLITTGGVSFNNTNFTYSFYVILATICYATSVNIIKKYLREINSATITAIGFLSIGPFTAIYLFFGDFYTKITTHPDALLAIVYIAILAIFGTAIAVILFNMLIKKVSILFATSVTYLIPVVAIFWGWLDGEIFNIFQGICIIITLLGIYFINKFR